MTPEFDRERVLSRVKKMLALANDAAATEGERDNAIRMAHATLAKYNLDLAEAEAIGQAQNDPRGSENFEISGEAWARTVAYAIAELFFCNMFFVRTRGKPRVYFVGRSGNIATAREMTGYVIDSIIKQSRVEAKSHVGNAYGNAADSWKLSFRKGASHQVYYRCKEIRKAAEDAARPVSNGTSLVLASLYRTELMANNDYIRNAMNLKLRTGKSRERGAGAGYGEGSEYGKRISLQNQIGGNNTARKRLT